jgi:hypothetical protein
MCYATYIFEINEAPFSFFFFIIISKLIAIDYEVDVFHDFIIERSKCNTHFELLCFLCFELDIPVERESVKVEEACLLNLPIPVEFETILDEITVSGKILHPWKDLRKLFRWKLCKVIFCLVIYFCSL